MSAEEDALILRGGVELRRRFYARRQPVGSGCIEWTALRNDDDYGLISVGGRKGRTLRAHRVAYILEVGTIPEGVLLDHTCHNHPCVNTEHLRQATKKTNAENFRGVRANNTSGVQGVSWARDRKKWYAKLRHNHKQIAVGHYDTIEEAAEAVRLKRIELHTYNDIDRTVAK